VKDIKLRRSGRRLVVPALRQEGPPPFDGGGLPASVMRRPNLRCENRSDTTRILFEARRRWASNPVGRRNARRQGAARVILAAGAVASPQLLEGPASAAATCCSRTACGAARLNGVGENLEDHYMSAANGA